MQPPHAWGRYFDDYTVGEVIKHWPGRTIRDSDDTWFTLLTMNTNPIHFDDHFASQSQHGRCLVNGTLVFSIVVGMSVRDISQTAIANLEYEFVRHLGPTFHGDTLYAESEILEKTESTLEAGSRHPLRRDARLESARREGHVAAAPRPPAAPAGVSRAAGQLGGGVRRPVHRAARGRSGRRGHPRGARRRGAPGAASAIDRAQRARGMAAPAQRH